MNKGASRGQKKTLDPLKLSDEPLCGCWEPNSHTLVLCETANTPHQGAFSPATPLPLLP